MFSNITNEVEEFEILKPVIVVHHLRSIRPGEVEKLFELLLYTRFIVTQHFFRKEIAFSRFSRGISNHSCCTSNKRVGLVPGLLKVKECHDLRKVTNMQ